MIVETHAVVDPGTMMVHAQHTHAADGAVVCPLRPWLTALLAVGSLARLPFRSRRSNRQGVTNGQNKFLSPCVTERMAA